MQKNLIRSLLVASLTVLASASAVQPESSVASQLVLVTEDFEKDGVVNTYEVYDGSLLLMRLFDGNGDGRLDQIEHYDDGDLNAVLIDRNRDGKIDWWELQVDGNEFKTTVDTDYDGVADIEEQTTYKVSFHK